LIETLHPLPKIVDFAKQLPGSSGTLHLHEQTDHSGNLAQVRMKTYKPCANPATFVVKSKTLANRALSDIFDMNGVARCSQGCPI
jgi:hypothetical protein